MNSARQPDAKTKIDLLYYEVMMLNKIPLSSSNDYVLDNLRLEGFIIHARVLVEFFKARENGDRDTDIHVSDFLDKKGEGINDIEIAVGQDVQNLFHRHLTHLTTYRLDEKIVWDLNEIKDEINQSVREFIEKLDDANFDGGNWSREDFLEIIDGTKRL